MASYALYWFAIEYFSQTLDLLNIGAGSGIEAKQDGLSQFKRGWATNTKVAYFCGKIFNQEKYKDIINSLTIESTDYFPAYRMSEF
jgi:lipid II:glycine glycyltransferase (peptidoglycan interpeptide bridge formation enzyme)